MEGIDIRRENFNYKFRKRDDLNKNEYKEA